MTIEEIGQLTKGLKKQDFLKFVYLILSVNPEWVGDLVKTINAATKDKWIGKED
jgi:hypothetical protein